MTSEPNTQPDRISVMSSRSETSLIIPAAVGTGMKTEILRSAQNDNAR